MSFQLEIDKAIKEKRLYFVGDSLPIDWYAGFKLWLILAQNGDVKAQYNVGRCYDRGDGVEQDAEKAKYWYLKAAESQDPRAFNNLFSYYSNENSNEINLEIAENYLNKAIELGEPRAIAYSAKRIADNILKEKNNKIQKENEFRIECQKKIS